MRLLLVFVLIFVQIELPAQDTQPDKIVDQFYSWYIEGGYNKMKPTFRELDNGMTDMDFRIYNEVHSQYNFSEQLIEKSRNIYKECRTNLSTIPYEEFQKFEDLDQFEAIKCNFQFWQWFGLGMEPYGYHELIESNKETEIKCKIVVGFAWDPNEKLNKQITVIVEQIEAKWQITNIDVGLE